VIPRSPEEPAVLSAFKSVEGDCQPCVVGDFKVTEISRTTAWRKRKCDGVGDLPKKSGESRKAYSCSKCKQPMTGNGHSQYRGSLYCPNFDNMTKEDWLASKKQKNKDSLIMNCIFFAVFPHILYCFIKQAVFAFTKFVCEQGQ